MAPYKKNLKSQAYYYDLSKHCDKNETQKDSRKTSRSASLQFFRNLFSGQLSSSMPIWSWQPTVVHKSNSNSKHESYHIVCREHRISLAKLERYSPQNIGKLGNTPHILIYPRKIDSEATQIRWKNRFISYFNKRGTHILELARPQDNQAILAFLSHLMKNSSIIETISQIQKQHALRLILATN